MTPSLDVFVTLVMTPPTMFKETMTLRCVEALCGPARRLGVQRASALRLLKAVMAAARRLLGKVAWPPSLLCGCLVACGNESALKVYIENRVVSGHHLVPLSQDHETSGFTREYTARLQAS